MVHYRQFNKKKGRLPTNTCLTPQEKTHTLRFCTFASVHATLSIHTVVPPNYLSSLYPPATTLNKILRYIFLYTFASTRATVPTPYYTRFSTIYYYYYQPTTATHITHPKNCKTHTTIYAPHVRSRDIVHFLFTTPTYPNHRVKSEGQAQHLVCVCVCVSTGQDKTTLASFTRHLRILLYDDDHRNTHNQKNRIKTLLI